MSVDTRDNIITIRLDEEYFETMKELVTFVSKRLMGILELWPKHIDRRERYVEMLRFVPGKEVLYRVNYLNVRLFKGNEDED